MSTRRNSAGDKQTQSSSTKCHLCSSDSPANVYRRPATWTAESREWVSRYVQNLPLDALVCDACAKYVKRHTGKTDVVPRWLPKERKPTQTCMVMNCKENARGATSITTYSIASQYIDLDECSRPDPDSTLALCNAHYQKLYRELEFPVPCAACGVNTRYGKNHVRRCPDPEVITNYLRNNTGFSGTITNDSRVCKACYHFHTQIIKHQEENPSLEYVKSNLQVNMTTFELCDKTVVTEEQYIDWLVLKVAAILVKLLENDEAVLLPELHSKFCHILRTQISQYPAVSTSIVENPPTTTWLLSSLSIHFKNTLGVVCKHRRYGTLLYKRDGDLLKALSKALGNATGIAREAAAQLDLSAEISTCNKKPDNDDDLARVCLALNKKVHSQAKVMIQTYSDDPLLCAEFDPNKVLAKLDPQLIKCMQILTAPVRSRHKLLDSDQDTTTSVKQLYCLATILYVTNNQCYMPLHYILTDAILCMGGSAELVRVLNRFGACVSLDTHNRISTRIVTMRKLQGIQSQLTPRTLTVLSIDNIDLMQINAMVSALHAKRSWHGTSVQCVQPLPTSSILCDEEITSPLSTPNQSCLTNSPVVKHLGKRRRTLKEHAPSTVLVAANEISVTMNIHDYADYLRPTISQFTIDNFLVLQEEEEQLDQLKNSLFRYFCLKEGKVSKLPGLASCVSGFLYRNEDVEESNVVYVDIVSLPADSKDTILQVLNKIYSKFVGELRNRWVIVVGDAKTFDILQDLKNEHGKQMEWMLPFPGDWHILFNYQKVLLKIYGDAGLLQLAKVSGHRAETLTSLAQASHFKRTHHFILQSFEAIMRAFIRLYLKNLDSKPEMAQTLSSFHNIVNDLATRLSKVKTLSDSESLVQEVDKTFTEKLSTFYGQYTHFVQGICLCQDTTRFWYDYITVNSMAYIALFVAIRNGDWVLRLAAIKLMAAVFHAFDRPIYQRIIPRHLADLLCFPPQVLHHLQKGAMSVRLTKSNGRAVALDEAHEMKINRDAKFAVIRPSEELMERISNFLPFRAQCINNLKLHLGLEKEEVSSVPKATSRDVIADQNITVMLDYIEENKMLPTGSENLGLQNLLSHIPATPEQAHDLLNFRKIGQEEFQAHINYRILRDPSVSAPERRKRLHTFSSTKARKKKEKQLDKERKLHQTCMKKMMVMFSRGENMPQACGSQFSPLPLALVGHDGLPYKGNKSKTTDFFETRYKKAAVIVSDFPQQWVPDSVILEGMFMIQTPPSPGIATYAQYCKLLVTRYISPHLKAGVIQVHVLFDDPRNTASPKQIEHAKRDETSQVSTSHMCIVIDQSTTVPSKWRDDLLNCRQCKRTLCEFLSHEMLTQVPSLLSDNQTLLTAGGFSDLKQHQCWSVQQDGVPQPLPYLRSNAEETDLRAWLHCTHSAGTKKLLYSPDTDVYHIGLPIIHHDRHLDVYIQLKGRSKDVKRYIRMGAFIQAIEGDPDLAHVSTEKRSLVLQATYVATGCDYTSYFKGIGKVFFLNVLFQHAKFITSGSPVGSLADFDENNAQLGQLAFIRLVGCAYHKKHVSAFSLNTPEALYNSVVAQTSEDAHKEWLQAIRVTVWERTVDESYYVPSFEALQLHWKRCTWVLQYWKKAKQQTVVMPSITQYGWYDEEGQLKVHWDTEANMRKVEEQVEFLTKGCRCKTGCDTKRCKCKKAGLSCGPSCRCMNCKNNLQYTSQQQQQDKEQEKELTEEVQEEMRHENECESEESEDDESSNEMEMEENNDMEVKETMEEVFGLFLD